MSALDFIIQMSLTLFGVGFFLSLLSTLVDKKTNSAEKRLENLLPGINCGQCGYPGCASYAKALANKEAPVNLCKPAGAEVAKQLGALVGENYTNDDDFEEQLFAPRKVAYIHETQCTGCGKCKRKCPVDAIAGVIKETHIVDHEICIGCDECINTCPEKCIEKITLERDLSNFNWNIYNVIQNKSRN
jgi:electron transport complex protein RnfB